MRAKRHAASVAVAILAPALIYFVYAQIRPAFNIGGTVINEGGAPLDGTIYVTEGHRVSITQVRTNDWSVPITAGHFHVETGHCSNVTLDIESPGFQPEYRSYSQPSNVPTPLQIVLHKKPLISPS